MKEGVCLPHSETSLETLATDRPPAERGASGCWAQGRRGRAEEGEYDGGCQIGFLM